MAIRIKIDGIEVETDTAMEAVEVYQQLSVVKNGHQNGHQRSEGSGPITGAEVALGEFSKAMLKVLLAKPTGEEREALARAIGVASSKGLAHPTRQIREWAKAKFGLDGDVAVHGEDRQRDGQTVVYTVLGDPLLQRLRGHEKELLGG